MREGERAEGRGRLRKEKEQERKESEWGKGKRKRERERENVFAKGYAKLFYKRVISGVAVSISVNLEKKWLLHFTLHF